MKKKNVWKESIKLKIQSVQNYLQVDTYVDESCEEMWYLPLKAFNVNCKPFFGAEMSDTKWNVVLLGGSVLKSNRNLILRARIYLAKLYTQLKPNVIKWIRSDKKGDSMLIGTSFGWSTLEKK